PCGVAPYGPRDRGRRPRRRRRGARPSLEDGHGRRLAGRAHDTRVRPDLAPRRAAGHRRPAGAPPRAGVGARVPRRDAHGRRARGPAAPQARPPRAHPHRARRGVQARAVSLRSRLFAGISATVLVSLVVTVVAGALLTRRSLEHASIKALERQVELVLAQRQANPGRGTEQELGQFLATDEQRLAILTPAQAELLLPADGADRLLTVGEASGS